MNSVGYIINLVNSGVKFNIILSSSADSIIKDSVKFSNDIYIEEINVIIPNCGTVDGDIMKGITKIAGNNILVIVNTTLDGIMPWGILPSLQNKQSIIIEIYGEGYKYISIYRHKVESLENQTINFRISYPYQSALIAGYPSIKETVNHRLLSIVNLYYKGYTLFIMSRYYSTTTTSKSSEEVDKITRIIVGSNTRLIKYGNDIAYVILRFQNFDSDIIDFKKYYEIKKSPS